MNTLTAPGKRPSCDTESRGDPAAIDFRRSLPPIIPSLHSHLASSFHQLSTTHDLSQLVHGGTARGTPEIQCAGAQFVAARLGRNCDPQQIFPTNGTQSALLILLPYLVGRGGVLLAERLSYGALRTIADAVGVELRGLDIDADGILPDAFERACQRGEARALYCNPTVQNPTTAIMPPERRQELAEISRRFGVPIIEDDALGRLHPNAASPIAQLAPDVVWYVMSTSKALAHGLRLAYVVAPSVDAREQVLAPVETLSFWNASPLSTAVVSHWIATGEADRISSSIREENRERERFARGALGSFGLVSQPGSMHVWLPLSSAWTRSALVRTAAEEGVLLRGSERFAVDEQPLPNAVRLSLSTPPTRAAAEEGILRLARVLERGS